jgi:hypothetical protein
MNLQGRNLTQGLAGPDVATLHRELSQLGFVVPPAEAQASQFGAGTLAAVEQLQAARGIPAKGVVDAATADALGAMVGAATFAVSGHVTCPVSAGLNGLSVRLVDKNVGGDVVLASTKTDAAGAYTLSVVIGPPTLNTRLKSVPDLQTQVVRMNGDGIAIVAVSPVAINAKSPLILDIALTPDTTGLPSEYETLSASLAPIYAGRLKDLKENDATQDVTYLGAKSGWDARAVAMASLADQLSTLTVPVTVATTAAPTASGAAPAAAATATLPAAAIQPESLGPEFYYALFRAGVPADTDALFRTRPATVSAIWTQAVAQGVIPKSLGASIPQAVQTFQALAGAHLLTMPPQLGVSTISDLVAPTLTGAGQAGQFAALLSAHAGDWTALWPEVEKKFGAAARKQLQLVGQLSYLTLDNAPLLAALSKAEAQKPLTAPIDLATRGYFDAAKWIPLIGQSVPAAVPGANAQEKAANYAAFLAAQVRLSFPTATLAQRIKSGGIPLAGSPAAAGEAADFLAAHQADFVFGVEPVEAYVARNKLTPSKTAVFHLKRLQRTYQMTTSDQTLSTLLNANLDSAFAITRYDAGGFVRAYADKLGGAIVARAIHDRARQIHKVTLNVALSYATQRVAGAFGRAPNIIWPAPPQGGGNGGGQTVAGATLESLFGSLDTCGCTDCQSILSPAAYLTDLLHYLDQPAAPSGANPQTVLFGRRPDLQYLPLTCENTQVALPYIDIVNETLEYFVANGLKIDGFQGFDTGEVTSAELIATPQHVNDAAYAALQGAFFPAPLPFNRPLTLLRGHMGALSITTADAMELLRDNDAIAVSPPNGADYSWNDILIERLRLSRDELRIFVDPALQLGDLVGLAPATALATLRTMSVHDLVRRTQISYDDLVAILQAQFVNPGATLIPKLERLGAPFTTIKALRDNPASVGPSFIAALPANLDYSQYGGPSSTTGQDVVAWLISDAVYLTAINLITIANPSGGAVDCTGTKLQLRYANPDNNANLLSGTDWLKLVRFIRLWRKVQALLGGDNPTTIRQTDALLAALYPPDKLPANPWDAGTDAANRPLLDAGFLSAIRRAGFVLQAIGLLGLDANAALAPLLACVAPIGTTASPSFYETLFDAPTLTAIDPGAPTATLTGKLFTGDVLRTTINGANVDHTVAAGETPAAAATAIAAAINASPIKDPASNVAIGQRFHAAVQGPTIILKAGFVVTVPAQAPGTSETLTLATTDPTLQTLTVGGNAKAGDMLHFAIDGVPISYTVGAGDTLAAIADALRDAVNATSAADSYCDQTLNTIVAASSANRVVTLIAAGAGADFALSCTVQSVFNASYAVDPGSAPQSATVAGKVAPGAILTTSINGVSLTYTATAADTNVTIAAAIAASVNASALVDPLTGLAVNALVSAAPDATVKSKVVFTPKSTAVGFKLLASITTTSYAAGRAASPFADNGYGVLFADSSQRLLVHEPFLCAACNLTGAEFAQIVQALNFDLTTPLTLANVSALYRNGWLAHALGMSVLEFLRLKQCSGLDPFAPIDPGTAPNVVPPLIRFIRMAQSMTSAGLDAVQALYLIWNEDISGALAPKASDIAALALTLRKDFAAVESTFARKDDPNGAIAQALMALVYGASDAAFFFSLISGSYRASVAFANAGPVLPQNLLAAFGGRLAYDDQNKLMTATGYLDLVTQQAIKAVLAVNTTDKADKVAAGAGALLTPLAMTNIAPGAILSVDSGANAELIAVTAVTATTFTADLARPHDGTATPFAIVNDPSLPAAIDALGLVNQQAVAPFFAQYPELRPLYDTFVTSTAPLAQRYTDLLANFLPTLKQERKRQQALTDIASAMGQDASFAIALLQDTNIIHAAGDAASPAVVDLTGVETGGLSARIFLDGNLAGSNPQVLDIVSAIRFAQIALLSGAPVAGATVSTLINGVTVPYVVAAMDLDLPTLAGNLARAINAASAIDPKTGAPIGTVIAASAAGPAVVLISRAPADPKTAFTLGCSSSNAGLVYQPTQGPLSPAVAAHLPPGVAGVLPAGNGGGPLAVSLAGFIVAPQDGLYNFSVVVDAGAKATVTLGGVASVLSFGGGAPPNAPVLLSAGALTPIALLATGVKTTLTLCWQSTAGLGWQPVPGQYLFGLTQIAHLRDTYVRLLKATSLASALTLDAHEIAYLGYDPGSTGAAPAPDIGRGWLNVLPGSPFADPLGAAYPGGADGARLRATLQALLDFARLKKALSPGDERVMQTLQRPGVLLANGQTALASLTGWQPASLNALLIRFTGASSLDALRDIETFARVRDALAIVTACRVSAGALLAALTNAPSASNIAALQSALRAHYAAADWRAVVKPINDALRVAQRDALVACILQGFKSKPPAPPYDGVDTADKLFEFLLMDVENQPTVLTSRIRLALSSVQLFIERVQRGLEQQVAPSDIDAQQWQWMKRYRVWQANREVFLWPENWLYPELRDDQSPIFKKTLSALLQSDLTDDAAAQAYLGYLSALEQIAKLEPCGIYYVPAQDGTSGGGASDEIAYVVARTAGAHRKHFFRRLEGGSWTPWEEVKIDCEDMPLTPIVWNNRLLLFWLRVLKGQSGSPSVGTTQTDGAISGWKMTEVNQYTGSAATGAAAVTVKAVLCWSEFYNGAWQDTKTSDVNDPVVLQIPASATDRNLELDRNRFRIVVAPYREYVPADALILAILPPNDGSVPAVPYGAGFVLHNTHSLPTNTDRIRSDWGAWIGVLLSLPVPLRTLTPSLRYFGDQSPGTFSVARYESVQSIVAPHVDSTAAVLGFNMTPRYVEPQIGPGDATCWPFFYEDKRSQFYVTIQKSFVPYPIWNGFGLATSMLPAVGDTPYIPPLTTTQIPSDRPPLGLPDPGPREGPGEPWVYAGARNVVAALSNQASFSFQGRTIGLTGGAPSVLTGRAVVKAGG